MSHALLSYINTGLLSQCLTFSPVFFLLSVPYSPVLQQHTGLLSRYFTLSLSLVSSCVSVSSIISSYSNTSGLLSPCLTLSCLILSQCPRIFSRLLSQCPTLPRFTAKHRVSVSVSHTLPSHRFLSQCPTLSRPRVPHSPVLQQNTGSLSQCLTLPHITAKHTVSVSVSHTLPTYREPQDFCLRVPHSPVLQQNTEFLSQCPTFSRL